MLLTKRLRAGILLYALFMAAVFALFLQFYMGRVKASHQVRQALYHQTQASLMAEMTKDQATEDRGSFQFDHGSTSYQQTDDQLLITVELTSGHSYRYEFFAQKKPETEETDKPNPLKKEKKSQADQQLTNPETAPSADLAPKTDGEKTGERIEQVEDEGKASSSTLSSD